MTPLGKLAALDASRRRLLTSAFVNVVIVRLALWLVPFNAVRRACASRAARLRRASHTGASVADVRWAITAAAARVPRASCLTQSLAGLMLFAANGHDAAIRFGVAKEDGRLRAHSWLESDGLTILGDAQPDAFVPLPPLALPR